VTAAAGACTRAVIHDPRTRTAANFAIEILFFDFGESPDFRSRACRDFFVGSAFLPSGAPRLGATSRGAPTPPYPLYSVAGTGTRPCLRATRGGLPPAARVPPRRRSPPPRGGFVLVGTKRRRSGDSHTFTSHHHWRKKYYAL